MDIRFRPPDIPHRVRQWYCGIAERTTAIRGGPDDNFLPARLIAALAISFFLVAVVGGLLAVALAE